MVRKIFVFILLVHQTLFASFVDEQISKLSYNDRFYLKVLFQDFLHHELFGHVLFFETKPSCLICFDENNGHFLNKQLMEGWSVWKKNEQLFPHPNFIILDELIPREDMAFRCIFICNKKVLKKCLEEKLETFQEFLGEDFTIEGFFKTLEKENKLPSEIHNNDCLLGIILGYGEESARAFYEKHRSPGVADVPKAETYQILSTPTHSRCHFSSIGFMGNPHSAEAKSLIATYESELQQIWSMYQKKRNSTLLVLETLCAE